MCSIGSIIALITEVANTFIQRHKRRTTVNTDQDTAFFRTDGLKRGVEIRTVTGEEVPKNVAERITGVNPNKGGRRAGDITLDHREVLAVIQWRPVRDQGYLSPDRMLDNPVDQTIDQRLSG